MKLDILAIGVHPDDVELGCSGTILKEIAAGRKVGILDLTQGELGTRGNVETRYQEATNAAMILGVHIRENLKLRDGFFVNDEDSKLKLISIIRKYQPTVIIGNIRHDRHPDHGRAGELIREASFLSGLARIETKDEKGNVQVKWRPRYVLEYLQDFYHEPDFMVDISDVFDQRMKSIMAYGTQFHHANANTTEPQTYISTPEFIEAVIARALDFGKRIGVKYAEGFLSEKKIGIRDLGALIQNET